MAQSLMKNMCSHFLAPYTTTTTRERERENIGILVLVKLPTFQIRSKEDGHPHIINNDNNDNNNAGKLRVKNLLSGRYSGKLYIKTWKKTVLKPA